MDRFFSIIMFANSKKLFSCAGLLALFLPLFASAQGLFNNAYCAGVSSPDLVPAGKAFTAQITMANTGTKEWTPTASHRLGSQSGSVWGITEIDLPYNVPPRSSAAFRGLFWAPLTPGNYPFNWRMREGSGKWFGETCVRTISVGESEVNFSAPQAPDEPTSEPGAPVATTRPATLITDKAALLNGAVHPRRVSTTAWFEWGDTPSLGRKTQEQQIGSGTDARNFSFLVTNLLPDTRYFFRAVGQNRHGTATDALVEFRTLREPPPASVLAPLPAPSPPPAPSPAPQPSPSRKPLSSEEKKSVLPAGSFSVTLSADKNTPVPGDEVFLVLGYENMTEQVGKDARLRLVLPPSGVQFVTASVLPSAQGRGEVAFRIGEIPPGGVGSIVARVLVNGERSHSDPALVFQAVLEYQDAQENTQTSEAFLAFAIGERVSRFAPILIALVIGLPILIIIGLILLFFWMKRKREEQ